MLNSRKNPVNRRISRRRLLLMGAAGLGGGFLVLNWGVGYLLKILRHDQRPLPPMPVIIPRKDWDARPPNHKAPNEYGFTDDPTQPEWYVYPENLADIYRTVVIHHSASRLFTKETMRDIQELHNPNSG